MLKSDDALPSNLPPRGLNREASARYIGVSPGKFDELVADGLMPGPKRVGTRKIWDRNALDVAFDQLPSEDDLNPWDSA